jgi:hypothetical protein
MKYVKQQILHERKVGDRQLVITGDGQINLTPKSGNVTINGNLIVTGNIPGAEENALVYYVSLEGDDNNSGLGPTSDRAKKTIKAAVEAAPVGAIIQVAPGDYYEDNPITLKVRQTVRGDSLRTTNVWPNNNQDDIFYVDNACYIYQITFRGLADPGFCVKIKSGALVTTSPYVQNCSNINGPWLNDGTEFVPFETVQIEGVTPGARPIINDVRVPLAKRVNETGGGNGILVDGDEYDPRSLVRSMVADAFTQIAQGGIGFHITNFGYTQIVSCFTVFCRTGFLTTNGGYLSISNSVSDFGTYAIIADGVYETPYTTARPTQDYYSTVGSVTITNQGSGYISAPAVVFDPPTAPGGVTATGTAIIDVTTGKLTGIIVTNPGSRYTFVPQITFVGGSFTIEAEADVNLTRNISVEIDSLRDIPQVGSVITFDGDVTKYYITSTDITEQPLIYDENICRRDVARIVDAIMGDVALGTTYQSLAAGRSYLRVAAQKVIRQQLEATVYGLESARDLILDLLPDSDAGNLDARYDIIERFAIVTNMLDRGDSSAAPDVVYNDLPTLSSGTISSKDNILANREFIIDEITKYIAEQFTYLSYNQDNFDRDVRLAMESVAYDVALGTNYNAVTTGLTYQRSYSSEIKARQITQTLAAFTELKSIVAGYSAVVASPTANTRSNTAFNEIIELIGAGDSSSANDIQYPNPTSGLTSRINAKNHLRANREFIQEEILEWTTANHPTLSYDSDKFYRDVGYIIDALSYDILYKGNTATRNASNAYFIETGIQPVNANEIEPTVEAYQHLQYVVGQIILGNLIEKTPANPLTQDTSNDSATGSEVDEIFNLVQIFIDVIDNSTISGLPTASYPEITWATSQIQNASRQIFANKSTAVTEISDFIIDNYPDFTYDRTKCKRDVALILDAVARDVRLNTNYNSITAGLAYKRATASVVDANQLPATILALRETKRLAQAATISSSVVSTAVGDRFDDLLSVIEYEDLPSEGKTFNYPPSASTELRDASRQLQDNRDFLIAETIAWINDNYFIYDSEQYSLNFGLIIDAVSLDVALGTNYNSVAAGLSYQISTAQPKIDGDVVETVSAITHLKSLVGTLLASSANALLRSNAGFDEIIDIIVNGTEGTTLAADHLIWDESGVPTDQINAKEQLQNNRDFIGADLVEYVQNTYPLLTFNTTNFNMNVKLFVDALSHDIMYGGNYATRIAAQSYWNGTTSVVSAEQAETVAAFNYLTNILGDIIQGIPVTPQAGNSELQDLGSIAASSTEVDRVVELTEDFANVIEDIDTLPAQVLPDFSWVSSEYANARISLQTQKSTLQSGVISYINSTLDGLTYDELILERDTGLLIDAVTHDLLYSGNRAILVAARAYYNYGTIQIPTQEEEISAAYEHLKGVAADVIEGIAVTPTPGNTESQVLTPGFGLSTHSDTSNTLFDVVIDAINDGLVSTPQEVDPDYSWNTSSVDNAATNLLAQSSVIQQGTIDFITNNLIGFSYNVQKCQRDVSYIIDAAVYDMTYGGNKQTRRAAEAYYNGAVLGNAIVGTADQSGVSEFSYKHLATVLKEIALNNTITPSEDVTETQVIGSSAGSSISANYIWILVEKIAEVIKNGNTSLPTEVNHSYSTLADVTINAKRELILTNTDDIVDETIIMLNQEYGGTATISLFPGVTFVLDNTLSSLQNVSTISTSGHAFEYVGAGITYNALPFFGGVPIAANEFVETNNGKVFAGGVVDQIGNFKVGNFFRVNALTGAITLNANEISLSGITSIGPFRRDGIPVGVELREVSENGDLTSSLGIPDSYTVPTQTAVISYVENRYLNKITGGTVEDDVIFETDIQVNGGDLSSTAVTFNLINDNAQTVNAFGGATDINIGALIGTTTVNNTLEVIGTSLFQDDVTITGIANVSVPDNTSDVFSIYQGSFNYFTIDTVNGTENVTFGETPIVNILNTTNSSTYSTGALVVTGGVGIGGNLSVNGDLTINGSIDLGNAAVDSLVVTGDAEFNIPDNIAVAFEIKESTNSYVAIDTTNSSESIKFGTVPNIIVLNETDSSDKDTGAVIVQGGVGIEKNLNVGANLSVVQDATVTGDLSVNGGDITTTAGTFNILNTTATTVNAFGAATTLNIGAATGTLTVNNELTIFDSVASIQLPVGTTAERPTSVTGQVRFNTNVGQFEGYDGIAWNSLGGVRDVDGNTYIIAESSPAANENELMFYTDGIERMNLSTARLRIDDTVDVRIENTTASSAYNTGALTVTGGVGIGKELHVNQYIGGNTSGVLQLTNYASDKIIIKASTIESPEEIKFISNAPDSSADAIVYPIILAHHSVSGTPTVNSGTGLKFELETDTSIFTIGGILDVVVTNVTNLAEYFEMSFKTMTNGTLTEKFKLGSTVATITGDLAVNGGDITTSAGTFNLLNVTPTTINAFGNATVINIGKTGGLTTFDQSVTVNEDLTVDEDLTVNGSLILTNNDLAVQYGGTGASTFTENGILYGDTANPIQVTAAAGASDITTSYQILTVTSNIDSTPVWTDTIDGGTF